MLYDQLGVRFVRIEVSLFPPDLDRFPIGALSALYARLNRQDIFDNCGLRQRMGATFEGETLTFDVTADRMELEFRAFQDFAGTVKEQTSFLLAEAQEALKEFGLFFIYLTKEIEVRALVPVGTDANVGTMIRRKLPKKLQEPALPGEVRGAGIELVGATDDYRYTATIAPFLMSPDNLYLGVEVSFNPMKMMEDPERLAGDPLAPIADALQTAYDLCTTDLASFAQEFLP